MIGNNILSRVSCIRERSYIRIEEALRREGFEGITASQGDLFMILGSRSEPVRISEFVERTGKAKSTITSNLKTLEKHSYVFKVRNPDDSRSFMISLTDKGRSVLPLMKEISEELYGIIYKDISEDSIRLLSHILGKIETNLSS